MASYSRPSEPLPIARVLDDGLRLYRVALGPLLLLSLLLAVGQLVATAMVVDPRNPTTLAADLMGLVPLTLWVLVLGCFATAAMIDRLDRIAAGADATLAQALAAAVRRFLPLFVAWLLFGLITTAGLFLLVVPGLYLMVTLSFLSFPLVLDGRGPVASLQISHRLVQGFWWHTATVMTIAVIIAMLPYLGLTLVLGLVAVFAGGSATEWVVLEWLLEAVVDVFVVPLLLCLMYSIYRDLRLRKEAAGAGLQR